MPRTSRLTIKRSDGRPYGSGRPTNDAVAFVRYESDDEDDQREVNGYLEEPDNVVHEAATYRVITEVVSSTRTRRSRQIQFNEDVGLTAPSLDMDVDQPAHIDECTFTWG